MNIQSLAIEMYKTGNNLPGGNLSEFFVRNYHNYNLFSKSELTVPSINTVFKSQNSISYFGLIIWINKLSWIKGNKPFSSFQIRNETIATNKLSL